MSVLSDASEFDISGASDALKKTLVVIPALNEEPHIEKCIRSLNTDALIDNRTKVIVADGGSTDGTPKIVESLQKEFPNLTLVRNAEKLQSAGINLAVREEGQEDTRFVVRCDAHSIYPPRFVERVVSRLDDTGAASLVVAMDALGEGCFGKANAWVVDTPLGSGGSAHRGGRKSGFVDHGHHAGFKFETFQALGGYDASFSHNEDAEYDQRVRAAGEKIYLDSDIRIRYIPRSSARHLAKQYFNYGKGRARTVQKHKQRLRVRQAIPVLALLACVASLAMATWRLEALIIPGVYLVVLLLTSIWIAISQRSICGLFAGLASGIMHMSWAAGFLKQILLGFDQHPSQLADLSIRSNPAKPVDNLSGVGTNVKQRTGSVFLSPWRGFNRVLYMVHRDLSRFVRSIGPKSPPSASEQSNRDNNPSLLDRGVTRLQNLLASPQLSEIELDGDMEPFDGRILHNSRGVSAPPGEVVYAIGDVHGHLGLLEMLLDKIDNDVKTFSEESKPVIVFLGDYIDRGLQSKQVIDLLIGDRLNAYETVFIAGNHEEALLTFTSEPEFGSKWARFGGAETLYSYGVMPPRSISASGEDWTRVWREFKDRLPSEHLEFYASLQHYHIRGDYIFVHAGLRPGIPFAEQDPKDLMWIRDRFLKDKSTFSKLVVHGHTPCRSPELDHRRLGLDTGAYSTGILSAARLKGLEIKILST